jgi:hypothetical protein
VDCEPWAGTRSLKLTKVAADPVTGNDGLTVATGFTVVAGFGALDPAANGARVIVQAAGHELVLDALLPAGAYGGRGTRGWELRKKGREWLYTDTTGTPIVGIVSLSVADRSRVAPGAVSVKIQGRNGEYPVAPDESPLRAVVALDQTPAPVCGISDFEEDDCTFNGAGNALTCKKKAS